MATPTERLPRHRYRHLPTQVPDWAASRPVYRQRRPTATPLYPVVQHHLETFLTQAAEADPMGNGVPFWVEKDFRAYLKCGILAHGFARARCEGCGHERILPFSCKGRGLCPSCNTRRMAPVASHVTEHELQRARLRALRFGGGACCRFVAAPARKGGNRAERGPQPSGSKPLWGNT